MIKTLILLVVIFINIFSSAEVLAKDKFISLVYPVRGRDLWVSTELKQLENLIGFLNSNKLSATWLFQYDALTDGELMQEINRLCNFCEFGLFLEISEKQATDAKVLYKIDQGNWARPDKVFLSGYSFDDRKKMIDKIFSEYYRFFNQYPKVIGAWYVDPMSLDYMEKKYDLNGYVSLSDQYDTDGQKYWGKYLSLPFYSQKGNILVPANNIGNKLDIVQLQWAQRDLWPSYGKSVYASRHSFQANDYVRLNKEFSYFASLLEKYLVNSNPFSQVTIGLEVGQELYEFEREHLKQLKYLVTLKDTNIRNVSDFTAWYKKKYPIVSPITTIEDENILWVNSPCYRVGLKKLDNEIFTVFDLRAYPRSSTAEDTLRADNRHFLSREALGIISEIDGTQLIDNLHGKTIFSVDNFSIGKHIFDFKTSCTYVKKNSLSLSFFTDTMKQRFISILDNFKFSSIDGHPIFGISTNKTIIHGWWKKQGFGSFQFPFQTMARFKSPNKLFYE